jgi:hypothetical protein
VYLLKSTEKPSHIDKRKNKKQKRNERERNVDRKGWILILYERK